MNNTSENQKGITSPKVYSKDSVRFIKSELGNALDKIKGEAWVACNNQDRLCLDIAIENIEEVYDRVRDFEQSAEEVDAIIKRVAS